MAFKIKAKKTLSDAGWKRIRLSSRDESGDLIWQKKNPRDFERYSVDWTPQGWTVSHRNSEGKVWNTINTFPTKEDAIKKARKEMVK